MDTGLEPETYHDSDRPKVYSHTSNTQQKIEWATKWSLVPYHKWTESKIATKISGYAPNHKIQKIKYLFRGWCQT